MKNVLVVSNYKAGRKQAVLNKKSIHKFLKRRCQKFKFVSVEDLDNISIEDFDTFFASGGDGTVSKVASLIAGKEDKALAIIPSGTANLLAAKLGFSTSLQKTLHTLDQNKIISIDLLYINNKPSVLRSGFGYDADIVCKTPQTLKNKFGYLAYFVAGIFFALNLKSKTYELTLGKEKIKVDATCLIVANSDNMYRNMVSIAKDSKLNDGMFDVFILKSENPITFFIEFLSVIFGIKHNNTRAEYFHTNNLKIKNSWTMCHIDGEKAKLKNNIKFSIKPNALKVYSAI